MEGRVIRSSGKVAVVELKQEPSSKILDKLVTLKIKHPRRSLDANAYLWILCDKLAAVLGSTKEEIYQHAVREAGHMIVAPIPEEEVDRFIQSWERRGLGAFGTRMGGRRTDGRVNVLLYFGSSEYDSKEFSRLLDYIIAECKEQGIETLPPRELEALYAKMPDYRAH